MNKCWCGGRVGTDMKDDPPVEKCLESDFHDWSATGKPEAINKLYVAGPMSGYPFANYPAFNQVSRHLRDRGFTVVNPAEFGAGRHYVDFLREDLRMMLGCDGVATHGSWWESTGARNEVSVAGLLKMPVRPWDQWLGHTWQPDVEIDGIRLRLNPPG